jgi:fructose-1,6-bisphosphatase/inositol monophosphatase family enzyme
LGWRVACSTGITLLGGLAACAPSGDPITANRAYGPDDSGAVRQLTPAERREAVSVMTSAAAGSGVEPERPTPARHGVRWSDVASAVRLAASASEMAVAASQEVEGGWLFTLQTLDAVPATLFVRRVPPPTVVVATATVGSFGQGAAEARLLAANFRAKLEALGRKPGFEDGPTPAPPPSATSMQPTPARATQPG